jgi:outer membrane protein assembly factor BamA
MKYFGKQISNNVLSVIVGCLISLSLGAQKQFPIEFDGLDLDMKMIAELKLDTLESTDSLGVYQKVNSILTELRRQSFLACSADDIQFIDSIARVKLYLGDKYQWANIHIDSQMMRMLQELERPFSFQSGEKISPISLSKDFERIITLLENNGYPFAQASMTEIKVVDGQIEGSFNLNRNKLILFDTINLTNGALVSPKYLHRYLNLEAQSPYSKEKLLSIKKKLRQVPFLQLQSDPTVKFIGEKAIINLDLQKKNASRFDFLFGILPSTNNGESSLTIAVDLTADLVNKFGYGEQFFVMFQQLREEAQELELAFNFPFVLDTPFGLDTRFELFRNADQYIELETDLGIRYLFGGNNYLKVFWNFNSSRLLEIDSLSVLNSRELPQQLDVRYTAGGLELAWQNLNYAFNPVKGFDINIRSAAGFKKIIQNNEIQGLSNDFVDFSSAYDSLNTNAFQFKIESYLAYYFPVGKRSTIKSFFHGGLIIAEDATYSNELFRIGGHKLLRGFDEESLLADFYSVAGLEFRLLLAENSYLSLPFIDFGLIKNNSMEDEWNTVMGMGGGLHFETNAGIFSFSVAVGRQEGSPIDFGSTKAHFGYVSLF